MTYAIDTSVIVDHLRKYAPAVALVERLTADGARFVSSMVVRAEVLADMRPGEEERTRDLLRLVEWDPVTEAASEAAGEIGRASLPANPGIDTPDLLVAEVARRRSAEVLTTNIKHFRTIFPGLKAPYSY